MKLTWASVFVSMHLSIILTSTNLERPKAVAGKRIEDRLHRRVGQICHFEIIQQICGKKEIR